MRGFAVALMMLSAFGIGIVHGGAEAQVRSPRDSQISVHGRLMPPKPFDTTRIAPRDPQPAFTRRPPAPVPIGVDPGYRPLWAPGTYVWNGFTSTYIPGHYVWQTP
jgi:hypothetical protein